MTQKEKAKRYDEAIERARALNNGEDVDVEAGTTICEYIFPELKESEDERIRKAIIEFFELQDDNTTYSFIPKKDIIAWLEKQSKHLENYDEAEKEKADFVGDGFIECHADFLDFKEGNTYWLEYIGDDKYNVRSDNLLGKTYHITPCQLYTVFKKLTWLEKQSKHSIFNVPSREVILAIWDLGNEWKELTNGCISTEYGTQLDYIQKHWEESEYYLREKQGEKPQGKSALEAVKEEKVDNQNCVKSTDKVEPKFHKGDWITIDKDKPCQIISMDDKGNYIAQNCDDKKTHILSKKFCESYFHLWTIQDAKDGDVLSANWRVGANFWERIIIFKKYHSKDVKGLINAPYVEGYGNTFKNGKLIPCAKVPYYSTWTDNLYPATKEQHDLLFQTMKEAGYEWDADKKELKMVLDDNR
jgi:hypothetical protein